MRDYIKTGSWIFGSEIGVESAGRVDSIKEEKT
jgi:hypothetical protein